MLMVEVAMAFQFFPLYNIDKSVGKGGMNAADDVKLVQGLLEIIFSDTRSKAKAERYSKNYQIKIGDVPKPTGVYDQNTEAWIRLFQSYTQNASQDGKFDPLRHTGGLEFDVTAGGKQLQLFMLNKTALWVGMTAYMKLGKRLNINHMAKLDGTLFFY